MYRKVLFFILVLIPIFSFAQNSSDSKYWSVPFMSDYDETINSINNSKTIPELSDITKDTKNEKVITRFFVNNNCELRTFYIIILKGGNFNYSARQYKSYHNMLLKTQNRNYREKLHLVTDNDSLISFMAKAPRSRYFFKSLEQASGDVKMELLINANRHTITRSVESTKFLNTLNKEIEQCKNN